MVDIYELTINPDNEYEYLLDDKWEKFEREILPIKVKLWGPIKWTFKRELLWSKHGPVVKTDHGVYALRYSGHNMIGQIEQWFRMNKSSNLEEFNQSMAMMQIPMFNTLYADKWGNIFASDTTLTRSSSLNCHRSSNDPPPLAMINRSGLSPLLCTFC